MIGYLNFYNSTLCTSSETLLPANILSFIHISSNFSTSSIVCDLCLVITVTPLATSAFLIVSLFLRIVQIVDFSIPNWVARLETRTPFSCLAMISFLKSIMILVFFLFALLLSLSFFGPVVSYLIIYKKNTKHTEIQEKAQWIRVNESYTATDALADRCWWLGVFSARSFFYEYCRRWYSQLYRSTMLTACVFVTQDTVRHPRRSVFGKFVRKPNCSWSEAFLNRGLTVVLRLYTYFNLGARWKWVVNATPRPLYPREWPGGHCVGGWVGPREGLDVCWKSRPPPGFDPRTVQPVASCYTDWANQANNYYSKVKSTLQYLCS